MLVSILIPCYNARQWIGQAIDSALAQTWPNVEVIVVDDGSTDGSFEIIQSYGDRIRCERGPNRGGNQTRNRLLELAQGEWVQYLDADDYLLPDKIENQAKFIQTLADVDVLIGPAIWEYYSSDGARREVMEIPEPLDYWSLLASWKLPQTGAPLWRKAAILDVGGWDPKQPCCQEHELYLRLLMGGKRFAFSAKSGAVYRQWSDQTLCKRDIGLVHTRRLMIEQQLEDFLRNRGELTSSRLFAINLARFEIARSAWAYDRARSVGLIRQIFATDWWFSPRGRAAPLGYRFVFHAFGFRAAEAVGHMLRNGIWSRTT
ncbi:glycosyltransferase [Bradyrhizobium centrosematis]|uniref:glycosyltransferase n=1 Tax=Bradyrhizobium centrosematis TaxID=1300039 RepID=UPI0038909C77